MMPVTSTGDGVTHITASHDDIASHTLSSDVQTTPSQPMVMCTWQHTYDVQRALSAVEPVHPVSETRVGSVSC